MSNFAAAVPFTEPTSRVAPEPAGKIVCGRRMAPPRLEKIHRVGFHLWLPLLFPDSGTRNFRETSLLASVSRPAARQIAYLAVGCANFCIRAVKPGWLRSGSQMGLSLKSP